MKTAILTCAIAGLLIASPVKADISTANQVIANKYCEQKLEFYDYSPMDEDAAFSECHSFLMSDQRQLPSYYFDHCKTDANQYYAHFGKDPLEFGEETYNMCVERVGGSKLYLISIRFMVAHLDKAPWLQWKQLPSTE